jgi:hypothetical protein
MPVLQLPWGEAMIDEQHFPQEKAACSVLEMPHSIWRTALNLG